jgi:hypothetical protein
MTEEQAQFNTNEKEYELELTEPMLGTVAKDKDIYATYIASKGADINPDAYQEVETVEQVEEKGWTGFHRDDNGCFIYNYMVKGFLKSACESAMTNKAIKKIPAYKKWFDRLVFIMPRKLYFVDSDGKVIQEPDGVLERPLRGMTPKGERVSLARSDIVNPGRKLLFDIELFDNDKGIDFELIDLLFGYGKYIGLGQWRSGGYGQFKIVEA